MNHIGGSRNELDTRFLSLCSVFSLPFPSDDTIRYVFKSILSGHTKSFTEDIKSAVHNIIDMTVNLYKVWFFYVLIFYISKDSVNILKILNYSNINIIE